MNKLTLSVDKRVVARAKRYAKKRGTSVSRIVENYLDSVTSSSKASKNSPTPVLDALRGSLKSGSIEDYHKYLEEKYL